MDCGQARPRIQIIPIQQHAKVSAIYLMDREGNTLGASNWNEPLTFVGRNFAFRPYFREALAGQAGRFYGIDNATGEPGYFIAHPVYAETLRQPAKPIGVIAVKTRSSRHRCGGWPYLSIATAEMRWFVFAMRDPAFRNR